MVAQTKVESRFELESQRPLGVAFAEVQQRLSVTLPSLHATAARAWQMTAVAVQEQVGEYREHASFVVQFEFV